ncbi:MAG TPA: alanine racemase [Chthoniobacterales bacterium]
MSSVICHLSFSGMNPPHRCWAEIDLGGFAANLAQLRQRVAPKVQFAAVVKADAYGHGLQAVAVALRDQVDLLAVASATEGAELRRAGVQTPVMILGPAISEELPLIVRERFIPTLSTAEEGRRLAELVSGSPLDVHFVLDTGMGRIGLWNGEAIEEFRRLTELPQIRVTALSSHLPVADEDREYTSEQLERFRREADQLSGTLPGTILNSAGSLRFGHAARPGDVVRTGLALYGICPLPEFQSLFRPVLSWKTRVVLVRVLQAGRTVSYGRTFTTSRETKVATIGAGYGDGYPRHLSNVGAEVLIHGRRCPVLGRVTMDQTMVDVTGLPEVNVGDEVVLIGRQGNEEILASELARKAGTIAWEIFTAISKRVVRVYR